MHHRASRRCLNLFLVHRSPASSSVYHLLSLSLSLPDQKLLQLVLVHGPASGAASPVARALSRSVFVYIRLGTKHQARGAPCRAGNFVPLIAVSRIHDAICRAVHTHTPRGADATTARRRRRLPSSLPIPPHGGSFRVKVSRSATTSVLAPLLSEAAVKSRSPAALFYSSSTFAALAR